MFYSFPGWPVASGGARSIKDKHPLENKSKDDRVVNFYSLPGLPVAQGEHDLNPLLT